MCVCKELKAITTVAALVRIYALVLAGHPIPALLLMPIPVVLGHYHG